MLDPIALKVDLLGPASIPDPLGEVLLTDEGMTLSGYLGPAVTIPWEELAAVLQHPQVQRRLEEVWERS